MMINNRLYCGLMMHFLPIMALMPLEGLSGSIEVKVLNEREDNVSHFRYIGTGENVPVRDPKTSGKIFIPSQADSDLFFWDPLLYSGKSVYPHKHKEQSGYFVYEVVRPDGFVVTNGVRNNGGAFKTPNIAPEPYTVRITAHMQIEEEHREVTDWLLRYSGVPSPSWRETDDRWGGPITFRHVTRESGGFAGKHSFRYGVLRDVFYRSSQQKHVGENEVLDRVVTVLPRLLSLYEDIRTILQQQYSLLYQAVVGNPVTRSVIKTAASTGIKKFFEIGDSAWGKLAGVPGTLIYAGMTPEQYIKRTVLDLVGVVRGSAIVGTAGMTGGGAFVAGVAIGVIWSYAKDGYYQIELDRAVALAAGMIWKPAGFHYGKAGCVK